MTTPKFNLERKLSKELERQQETKYSSESSFQLNTDHESSDDSAPTRIELNWEVVTKRKPKLKEASAIKKAISSLSLSVKSKNFAKGKVTKALSDKGLPSFKPVERNSQGFSISVVINEKIVRADTAEELFDILDSEDWENFSMVNLITFFDRLTKMYKNLLESLSTADQKSARELQEQIDFIFNKLHDKEYWGEISIVIISFLPELGSDQFGPRHLSNFARYLAVFEIRDEALLDQIAETALSYLENFAARDLAEITWSFAKLQYNHSICTTIAQKALETDFRGFNQHDYSQSISAYAQLSVLEPHFTPFLNALYKKTRNHVSDLDISGLISVLTGLANSKKSDKQLFDSVANRCVVLMKSLNHHELEVIIWSMASSQNLHLALLQNVIRSAIAKMSTFTPRNLSMFAWSLASLKNSFRTLSVSFSPILESMAKRAIEMNLEGFTPQNLANIAWGFATLNIQHEILFQAIAKKVMTTLENGEGIAPEVVDSELFDNQALVTLAWAFATAKVANEIFFEIIVKQAKKQFDEEEFIPLQFSMLIWALGKNRQSFPSEKLSYEKPLMILMAKKISALNLKGFSEQHISNILWGLARLEIYDEDLVQKIIDWIFMMRKELSDPTKEQSNGNQMTHPQHVSNLMWALAKLKVDDRKALVALVEIALELKLQNYQLMNLTEMLWASATLRFEHKPFLRAVVTKVLAFPFSSFDVVHLACIAWSCAVLDFVDDKLYAALKNMIEAKKALMRIAECDQIYHFWQFTEMKGLSLFSQDLKDHLKKMMNSIRTPESSGTHLSVAATLERWTKTRSGYKYTIDNERRMVGFSADIWMKEEHGLETLNFVIEVMGEEYHYTRIHKKLIGHDYLKKRLLEAQGMIWIEVPVNEWRLKMDHLHYLDALIAAAKRKFKRSHTVDFRLLKDRRPKGVSNKDPKEDGKDSDEAVINVGLGLNPDLKSTFERKLLSDTTSDNVAELVTSLGGIKAKPGLKLRKLSASALSAPEFVPSGRFTDLSDAPKASKPFTYNPHAKEFVFEGSLEVQATVPSASIESGGKRKDLSEVNAIGRVAKGAIISAPTYAAAYAAASDKPLVISYAAMARTQTEKEKVLALNRTRSFLGMTS